MITVSAALLLYHWVHASSAALLYEDRWFCFDALLVVIMVTDEKHMKAITGKHNRCAQCVRVWHSLSDTVWSDPNLLRVCGRCHEEVIETWILAAVILVVTDGDGGDGSSSGCNVHPTFGKLVAQFYYIRVFARQTQVGDSEAIVDTLGVQEEDDNS
eukprot:1903826-Amphidinium_carterae.1